MLPMKAVTAVVGAAAALEVGTAAVLIVDPSLFSWLLFGASMTPPGQALGRISGVALLALAIACWPRSAKSEALLAAILALLLFSALTAACLLDLGIRGSLIGMLLWPAAVTHFVFAILLALIWAQSRAHHRSAAGDGA